MKLLVCQASLIVDIFYILVSASFLGLLLLYCTVAGKELKAISTSKLRISPNDVYVMSTPLQKFISFFLQMLKISILSTV